MVIFCQTHRTAISIVHIYRHYANDSNINYGVPATNKGPKIKEEKLLFLGSMMIWDYALMSQK